MATPSHSERTIFATHGEAAEAMWSYLANLGPHTAPDVETQVMPTEGGYCVQFYGHWADHHTYL